MSKFSNLLINSNVQYSEKKDCRNEIKINKWFNLKQLVLLQKMYEKSLQAINYIFPSYPPQLKVSKSRKQNILSSYTLASKRGQIKKIKVLYRVKQHKISTFMLLSFVSTTSQGFLEARTNKCENFRWFLGYQETRLFAFEIY